MQPSPQTGCASLPSSTGGLREPRNADYLTYQVVTIAAMLLLLVSLWVF
jgi:hypothetical protein